jgi:lipoprotein-releasing system permease protein
MKDYPFIMNTIASNRAVKAVAPLVIERVLLETEPANGESRVEAPFLRGIDPALESRITVLPTHIIAGKFDVSNRGLLIGTDFADNMELAVGDRVSIYSPNELKKMRESRRKGHEETILPDEYEVRGIFDVGYYEYDSQFVVTSLADAQELYLLDDSVQGLMVILHDPYQAKVVARELSEALGPDFRIVTWMEQNASFLGALVVEKNVMFYLLFCIMVVAALCILSAQITFVVQKTREIGMLKALGATDMQVSGLFLSQSGLIGVVGVGLGLGLGMLALAYRNEFLDFMNHLTGFELFPERIYGFDKLPALIMPGDIALICGSALVMCILGGVIPAWTAGRLKPVEALRHE